MIVSYHPCIEADKNITCAGREPGKDDLAAIQAADAVILSQGCGRLLYEMARRNCPHVFPNYDVRFEYGDKIGQTKLFRDYKARHPKTEIFDSLENYRQRTEGATRSREENYPFVFKFSWGGEGDSVFLIRSGAELKDILEKTARFESGGLKGFLLQEYIPAEGRTLRVVVAGKTVVCYWRVQPEGNRFHSSLSKGARVDFDASPACRAAAVRSVEKFCSKTGINLAGFDLIVPGPGAGEGNTVDPLFLEINYFFGRKGLGGSERFYQMLRAEVEDWVSDLGLRLKKNVVI